MLSNSVNQEAEPHSTLEEQSKVLLFRTDFNKVINDGGLENIKEKIQKARRQWASNDNVRMFN